MTQPPPNRDNDEIEDTRSLSSTTESHQGFQALSKILGTQEILSSIYEFYFEGIKLSPRWRVGAGDHNKPFEESRLALLLLCKSQTSEVRRIMMKSARLNLRCACDLAAVTLGKSELGHVQIVRCGPGLRDLERPFLTSRVLGKFENLKSVLLDRPTHFKMRIKHTSLLAAIKSPKSVFRKLAGFAVKRSQWIKALLSVAPPYEISIECSFAPRPNSHGPNLGPPIIKELEELHAHITFSSSTQILTGIHDGKVFSVVQRPVQGLVHVSKPIVKHDFPALLGEKVCNIVNEFFSDIELLPMTVGKLFSQGYCSANPAELLLESQTSQQDKDIELAWRVGWILLGDLTCGCGCPCVKTCGDGKLNPRELWRRLLKVDNKEVLGCPWLGAYKLLWDLNDLHNGDLSQVFESEKKFFSLLFDLDRPWLADEGPVRPRDGGPVCGGRERTGETT